MIARSHVCGFCVLLLMACATAPGRRAGPGQRSYAVPADVGRLVVDPAAFAELARAVRADLEPMLASAAGPDAASREERKEVLFVLALLDALDDRWSEAVARLDAIVALEDKPVARAMTGLTIRVWDDARAHGGDTPAAFRAALASRVTALPAALVREPLRALRAMGRAFTPEVCRQLVTESLGDEARGGAISLASVHAVAFQRYAVVRLVPVGKEIDEVLAAAGIDVDAE